MQVRQKYLLVRWDDHSFEIIDVNRSDVRGHLFMNRQYAWRISQFHFLEKLGPYIYWKQEGWPKLIGIIDTANRKTCFMREMGGEWKPTTRWCRPGDPEPVVDEVEFVTGTADVLPLWKRVLNKVLSPFKIKL